MRKQWIKFALVGVTTCSVMSLQAQLTNNADDAALLREVAPIAKNRLMLTYRLGLNITADFKKLGGFAALTDPGADTGTLVNRNYDNGYNRIDNTGNDHEPGFPNTTWNWGFQGGDSVQGSSIVLQSASSPSTAISKDNDDGVNHGFELAYLRELYREEKWRAGLEGAFGFTLLDIKDSRTLHNEVNLITDTYSVPGGVEAIPGFPFGPGDSYSGTFNGPGPLMDSTLDPGQRVRSVVTRSTTITGRRELDANIFLFRVGPYVEIPFTEKLSLIVNGGLNMAIGDTRFSYTETVAYTDGVRATRSAKGSQTDFLVGFYAGGGLTYELNEHWGVVAGAQFQTAGRSINNQGGKEAVLDMGETIVVTMGISYKW